MGKVTGKLTMNKKQSLELNYCGLELVLNSRSSNRITKVNKYVEYGNIVMSLSNLVDHSASRGINIRVGVLLYSISVKFIENLRELIRNYNFVKISLALYLVNKGVDLLMNFNKNRVVFWFTQKLILPMQNKHFHRYNYTNA